MTSNWEPKYFVDLAQRNWHKPLGLIFTVASVILFDIILLKSINVSDIIVNTCVYSGTAIVSIITWFYSNRFQKTHKGKVGFVVCIQCSNKEEEKKIKEDFITTLRKLLKAGPVGLTFHFIETPKHISESINDLDDAYKLKSRTKSHFLIFGRVRLRPLNGKDCHILELDGIVAHKPLATEVSDKISKEFRELFPRRLHITTENDLLSFNFTSDWTECVAKYIIGIASACSSDINYAEQLYTDVQKKLENIKTDFPIFSKLKERIPTRLSEIYISRSKYFFSVWQKTKERNALLNLAINLNKISVDLAGNYDVLLLRSIEAFLNGRKIKEAVEYTNQCKHYNDPIWHYNLAFLKAYEGKLANTIRQYRICEKYKRVPSTLSQIEDFMVWILEEEPEKYQYHYCLGFFNWKIKGDLHQALNDFKNFLKHVKHGEFINEKNLAQKWVREIKNQTSMTDGQNQT